MSASVAMPAFLRPGAATSATAAARGGAPSTLDLLRRRAVQIWAAIGWIALALLLVTDVVRGSGTAAALLAGGIAANLLPTMVAIQGRYDAVARTLIGTLAAIIPAMLVFLLRDHLWQMDAHMYFFVGLAGLVALADWRPLALATVLIALHHLALEWLAPQWVFSGSGDLGRVLFHVVAVGLQFVVLAVLTTRLAHLVDAQDAALASSRELADAAEAERRRAEAALAQMHVAEAEAARHRLAREEEAARVAAVRRDELMKLAERFERSVSTVVLAVGEASEGLVTSADSLDRTVDGTNRAAAAVAAGAGRTSTELMQVAASIRDLSQSIRVIADSAGRQTELTGQASAEAKRSVQTIAMLEEQTVLIEDLVDDIRGIAGKTNLLALNASIEAARAGEAGRGFTVVANEVKVLAADSTRASDKISALLAGVREGVCDTADKLRCVNAAIGQVAMAADGIASAVGEQRDTAQSVGASTDAVVRSSAQMEQGIAGVATAAGSVASLSVEVKGNAGRLAESARELRTSTDLFVSFLHAGPVAA